MSRLSFCGDAPILAKDLLANGLLVRSDFVYKISEIGRACLSKAARAR